jgi:hypothetical protein
LLVASGKVQKEEISTLAANDGGSVRQHLPAVLLDTVP